MIQLVLRTPDHDLVTMLHEMEHHLAEVHDLRHAADERIQYDRLRRQFRSGEVKQQRLLMPDVRDSQCPLKAFRHDAAQRLFALARDLGTSYTARGAVLGAWQLVYIAAAQSLQPASADPSPPPLPAARAVPAPSSRVVTAAPDATGWRDGGRVTGRGRLSRARDLQHRSTGEDP